MREIVGHLVALIADFCAMPRPRKHDKVKIESLILAHADIANVQELKLICSSLSQSMNTPRSLIIKLSELDSDICRPLLVSTPALKDSDFLEIIENSSGIEHCRLIARNPHIGTKTLARLHSLNDSKINRTLSLRVGSMFNDVDQPVAEPIAKPLTPTKTIESFFDTNIGIVQTALADSLGLSMASARAICSDLKSRNLPCALHYLQFSEDKAWEIYRSIARNFADQPDVESAFRATYAALSWDETKRTVSAWQLDELVAAVKFSHADNDFTAANSNKKKQA